MSFDKNNVLGAFEIGVLFSFFLFGVFCVQTYIYFETFPNDRRLNKAMVTFIWLLEVGQTISMTHAIYLTTVTHYGQPLDKSIKLPSSLNATVLMSGMIGASIQAFFADRIRGVSGRPYITFLCWSLSSLLVVLTTIVGIESMMAVDLIDYEAKWTWLITITLVISVFVDVMIAASLSYYLVAQQQHVYLRTTKIIEKLIMWAVSTGLVTSLTAIIMLICFLTMKHNFIWLAIYTLYTRLFSNSLLASLNARMSLRGQNAEIINLADTSPHNRSQPPHNRHDSRGTEKEPTFISIEMSKVTENHLL